MLTLSLHYPGEKKKKKKHKKDKEERTEEKAQEEERDDSIDVTELDKNSDELGQWGSSSLFQNDNRQEKFLRLMGGGGSGSGSGGGAHRSFVPGATQFQGKAKPRGIFQQRLSSGGGGGDEKKKNLYGSLQSAMTVDRAEKLNSNLCHQYEDARKHHFQQGKGTGLGFENQVGPDPATKTFHIDAASSNSKKFDD